MTDEYTEARRTFSWARPEKFNFARDVIDRWAEDPQKTAIRWLDDHGTDISCSFAQLSEASRKVCNVLSAAGVKRGDTLVLVLGRQLAWWEVVTACIRMGVVVSPGTTQLSAKDLAYRINACHATAVVTDIETGTKVDAVREQCPSLAAFLMVGEATAVNWLDYQAETNAASDNFTTADTASDEEALCYFTSGTTGFPKMVLHTHSYALGHEATGKYWLDLKPEDLHWNISDTGWAKAAWSSYFGPWLCGASLFVYHAPGFDPVRTLELLSSYPITTMCGAPTIYRMLVLQQPDQYQYPALRHCVGAGEPLNPEVIEVWKKATGLVIRDGFGQTETPILCGNFKGIEPRYGSMGKPAPGIDLAVVDEQGNVLPPHQEGDIAVKVRPDPPQGLFKGYSGEPEKTRESFRGDWYLTGDRATVDDDGYFWFVSRADDVILSAGYRIGPFEVESALLEHAAVAESAVVSSPDEQRGEVVKAFIVLAPGYDASDVLTSELQNHVKSVTAPYKYPRKIEFVDELPKTVSGKIRRVELRDKEWSQH
ncbi:MAG: AMP-binding protein [Gammaproteobacteria bacterium]|nr:AMP-binding protein [Gammaproteobacteria bacterium]